MSTNVAMLHINWKFDTACNKFSNVSIFLLELEHSTVQPNPLGNEGRGPITIYYYPNSGDSEPNCENFRLV